MQVVSISADKAYKFCGYLLAYFSCSFLFPMFFVLLCYVLLLSMQ